MDGNRDDKAISKDDVRAGSPSGVALARLRGAQRRSTFFWGMLGWGWVLFWVGLFLAIIGGLGSAIIEDAFQWSRDLWPRN